ncbi:MAG: nucleosidase [Candidatus Limimorpha sp.]
MKILLTYALDDERVDVRLPEDELVYVETGVGKVRSAMSVMRAICQHNPDLVINFGTAGTLRYNVGDIVLCNRFVDRDLRRIRLDGILSEIVFSTDIMPRLSNRADYVGATCSTGDSFVTETAGVEGDVVDMEAFAQALVCREMDLPFLSVKYITDVVGRNSVEIWNDKLADAREGLSVFFNM